MNTPDPPEPPSPQETAGAQTAQNISTAIAQQQLNNINQETPYGSLTYEQTRLNEYVDPNTGVVYDIPSYTATQTLSEAQQGILDRNQETQTNLSQLGVDQSAFLGDYMAEPFSYDPGQHENWAMDLYDSVNGDRFSEQDEALRSRLANQGIVGGEAYDREMRAAAEARQTASDRFLLDSYSQGLNTALTERNQPLNEIIGLMSGTQVQQPSFVNATPAGLANTDVAGLINANYDQRYQNYQTEVSNRNRMMGGLFGLATAFI